jgi:hypothetical protein
MHHCPLPVDFQWPDCFPVPEPEWVNWMAAAREHSQMLAFDPRDGFNQAALG